MTDLLLWKKLSENDFKAMRGEAAPSGGGGGAMHVALGVNSAKLDVQRFLKLPADRTTDETKTITTALHAGKKGALTFRRLQARRRGEWLIADQYSERHPLWRPSAGFPQVYHQADRPCVLVFRIGRTHHVRLTSESRLAALAAQVPAELVQDDKGVVQVGAPLLALFPAAVNAVLEELEAATRKLEEEGTFDASNLEDARLRVAGDIVRRQGQPAFRRKVIAAYGGRCAISREDTSFVLEAAHIMPFLGSRSNHVTNGLLLRSDLHTLFDMHMLSIDPADGSICVSPLLRAPYDALAGKKMTFPASKSDHPNRRALKRHHDAFLKSVGV